MRGRGLSVHKHSSYVLIRKLPAMRRTASRYVEPLHRCKNSSSTSWQTWNTTSSCLRPKASHIPSLPVIELMLVLVYLTIFCDIVYAIVVKYLKPKFGASRRPANRLSIPKKPHQNPGMAKKKKGLLTLDNLWKRLKAEAQHLQKINSQHRTITQTMMETRLQARSLERERSLSRTRSSHWSSDNYNVDMVRWAARISSDHDPRSK